jgi:elongation factor P
LPFLSLHLHPHPVLSLMLAKEIKPGTIVVHNAAPHIIEGVNVQSPSARGGATLYKFRARNLVTKQKADFTLKGTEGLDDADFSKRAVTFMFADNDTVHFLDSGDYNQYAVARGDITQEMQYITEGLEGMLALIYNGECVGIQLPAAVDLTVVECDPAVRGNSATSRTKSAKLETGAVVQVPEYLTQGEKVRVDTRSGEFLARA